METFDEYLTKKRIDSALFQLESENLWKEWKELFDQMHPDSFTAQKLFLINAIRRQFPASLDKPDSPTAKRKPSESKPRKD